MENPFCLVMGQINPVVGDVSGNTQKIIDAAHQARDLHNADLVVFPELTLTGYPPEDLLLRPGLIRRVESALSEIVTSLSGVVAVVIGHPHGEVRTNLFNAASFIADGKILATYHKQNLPNYSVFDEQRYFIEGESSSVIDYKGIKFGLTICEDIWFAKPTLQAVEAGAEIILNLNASPFHQGKNEARENEVKQRTLEAAVPIVYVNQVGGQDELVFDGGSFALSEQGKLVARAEYWQESLQAVSLVRQDQKLILSSKISDRSADIAMLYDALVLGLKDYVRKNNFPSVVIGLSGGVDSALTLALAVDALGAQHVSTVMMPSKYTAQISLDDAQEMAEKLGVAHSIISIDSLFSEFMNSLAEHFSGKDVDTTEENIQARCRGTLLMAISNKFGSMVLSTGNKSEVAVGYSTLYGDMAGGFSPLKDVYKTQVYQLCEYRNGLSKVIPERIITRPPSAELAPDQFDQDSLPEYSLLDRILESYIAQDKCYEDIMSEGYDSQLVARVISLVDRNEYKRRQAAPGTRVTTRAFGRDRRYPITSGYK